MLYPGELDGVYEKASGETPYDIGPKSWKLSKGLTPRTLGSVCVAGGLGKEHSDDPDPDEA